MRTVQPVNGEFQTPRHFDLKLAFYYKIYCYNVFKIRHCILCTLQVQNLTVIFILIKFFE